MPTEMFFLVVFSMYLKEKIWMPEQGKHANV